MQSTRGLLGTLGPLLDRYRGGMPLGFLAAIAQFESGGKMTAGDPNLGEYGIFQVAATTPPSFGYPAALRTDTEGNIFLGALEYNIEAAKQALNDPRVSLGSEDSWKLARLGFAIGSGGTQKLLQASRGLGGSAWAAVKAYVDQTGGIPLGSQSADKVRDRVHAVDVTWAVGQQAAGGSAGLPSIPPPPAGQPAPRVPAPILAKIASAHTAQLFVLAGVAAVAAWFFYFRRR